jgi:cyclopropane fatty-acyl-phospholipid synthase-like methyltransferase
VEGNDYWDHVERVEMGGTQDDTGRHLQVLLGGMRETRTVLEIGCGMGRLIAPLAEAHADAKFVGFDPSLSLLAQTPRVQNVTFMDKLPGASFDFIYSMLVFQHISNAAKEYYIRWAAQHLTHNGRFWFQYVAGDYDAPNHHQCPDEEMIRICSSAGIKLRSLLVDDVQPEWRWAII